MYKLFNILFAILVLSLNLWSYAYCSTSQLTFSIIDKQMIISKQDIADMKIISTDTSHGVELVLKKNAASKMQRLTKQNIDKKIQISIAGNIISSPVIRSEIGTTFLIATQDISQAKKIYQSLEK